MYQLLSLGFMLNIRFREGDYVVLLGPWPADGCVPGVYVKQLFQRTTPIAALDPMSIRHLFV